MEKPIARQSRVSILRRFWDMSESGIIIILIVYAIFVQCTNPKFLSTLNAMNFLRQGGYILLGGIGMTMVLIACGLDLSVGSVLALSGVLSGFAMSKYNMPVFVGIAIGLAVCLILGLVNGAIIMRFKIPPMIMTLGMMYMARGLVYITTLGVSVYPLPENFLMLEQSKLWGIPTVVPFALLLAIIFHFVLNYTEFGRSVYAIGGNAETAKLSGININKITIVVYTICGVMAGLTGLVYAARLGSAQPGSGDGYEMNVIAACIIGGTSTFGGRGTILGTVLGAIFMAMLSNSMTLMKIDVNYHKLVIGAVLVLAVILDQYKRELANKRATSIK
jgi:ribose transport system permease protein